MRIRYNFAKLQIYGAPWYGDGRWALEFSNMSVQADAPRWREAFPLIDLRQVRLLVSVRLQSVTARVGPSHMAIRRPLMSGFDCVEFCNGAPFMAFGRVWSGGPRWRRAAISSDALNVSFFTSCRKMQSY